MRPFFHLLYLRDQYWFHLIFIACSCLAEISYKSSICLHSIYGYARSWVLGSRHFIWSGSFYALFYHIEQHDIFFTRLCECMIVKCMFFSIAKLIILKYLFQKRIQFELISLEYITTQDTAPIIVRWPDEGWSVPCRPDRPLLKVGFIYIYIPQYIVTKKVVIAFSSYANPIRVAPPVSSHEYSNASKFNPKSADFRCIF